MTVVIALGEMLLRLKSPGFERLFQSPSLEATFGGTEANVLVSLAQWGVATRFVSAVPTNPLGDACVATLRAFGVDTSAMLRRGERLGVYFIEAGANQRPSRVTYDRAGSAFATAGPADFDWNVLLADGDWFHVSGVTPAVSATAAELAVAAARAARERGMTVSCDYNHRAQLWRHGASAAKAMRVLVAEAHVCIASVDECRQVLDLVEGDAEASLGVCRDLGERMLRAFPNLEKLAISRRESRSAHFNAWSALLLTRGAFYESGRYEITNIVDRIGTGDAFAAGLIYGLRVAGDDGRVLEIASAAACLKHSIPGDFNRMSVAEVEALVHGDASGRLRR